jgi:hypothetical protein
VVLLFLAWGVVWRGFWRGYFFGGGADLGPFVREFEGGDSGFGLGKFWANLGTF